MPALRSVALLIESSNAYARGLVRGISAYVQEHESWSVFLPEYERGHEPPPWFSGWKGHGVIARIENQRIADKMIRLKVPVIDVSAARCLEDIPWVETDDVAVARMGYAHFRERGFKNLAFCGDPQFNWSNWRCEQFCALAKQDGKNCVVYHSVLDDRPAAWSRETQNLCRWVRSLPKPVGIMACYDFKAQQLLDACLREGISVPEDVAVLGVDNDELVCELCKPRLSSVILDPFRTGYFAAQLLDRLMGGEKVNPQGHFIPPIGIETRQSSGLFDIEDEMVASALQFIERHASDGIVVEDVARAVNVTRRALDSRFVTLIGRTPHAEIFRVRLNLVKHFLLETELSLSVIADRTGFSHVEYLSVAFKRATGISPGEFRNTNARPAAKHA